MVLEQQTLKMVYEAMESGKPLREDDMTEEQSQVTRSFRLFTEKPRMVVFNTADDESDPGRFTSWCRRRTGVRRARRAGVGAGADEPVPTAAEFEQEMGLVAARSRPPDPHVDGRFRPDDCSSRPARRKSAPGCCPRAAPPWTPPPAIHTDLARGFIRAEIMTVSDLVRLGSEREVKAQHLVRQEPKDYVVKDDDILLIRFSV